MIPYCEELKGDDQVTVREARVKLIQYPQPSSCEVLIVEKVHVTRIWVSTKERLCIPCIYKFIIMINKFYAGRTQ